MKALPKLCCYKLHARTSGPCTHSKSRSSDRWGIPTRNGDLDKDSVGGISLPQLLGFLYASAGCGFATCECRKWPCTGDREVPTP